MALASVCSTWNTRVQCRHPACKASLSLPRRALVRARAVSDDDTQGGGQAEDIASARARLNQLLQAKSIDAKELRQLVLDKWGRSYDIRLMRRANKMYLQVMWKFLEQQSFHLSEEEYMEQLDAVASFINDWGVTETVRRGIMNARPRGPGYTGGTNARCVSIPLDVDLSGARSGEWN